MPGRHSAKEKRQAEHVKEGYLKRGVPEDEAERRAWATVNKDRSKKQTMWSRFRGKK